MRPRGIAVIATLIILAVIAVLVFGTFFTTQIEQFTTRNDSTSVQANYVAQAGLQKYKAALFQNYRWIERLTTSGSGGGSGSTACFSSLAAGIDFDRDGTPTSYTNNRITFGTEQVLNANNRPIGQYTVTITRDTSTPQVYTLESRGTSGGATSTVRMVVQMANTGLLNNAIFAGQGQANKFLNGNTSIRGGIYVVGSNPNNPVIVSNGNFQMLNDYDITNASNYDDVARAGMDSANQKASDLCAFLRVQNGQVDMSGSSQVGTGTNPLKGVYVGRGPQDIIGTPNSSTGCPPDKKYMCTNGGPAAFDLSDPPSFPSLASTGCDPTNASKTWRGCINDETGSYTNGKGLRLRFNGSGVAPSILDANGNLVTGQTLPSSCVSALKNNDILLGTIAQGKTTSGSSLVDCTLTVNGRKIGFKYDETGLSGKASLEVYGSVQLQGFDLRIYTDAKYQARTYSDPTDTTKFVQNASLVATKLNSTDSEGGNIKIEGNFTPNGNSPNQLFPYHVVGLVAEGDVFQQGQNIMAPVYAGQTFYTGQKRKLFGSVVSNYFCTTDAGTTGNVADYSSCNAGQGSEVIYVNTGNNKPKIMQQPEQASKPVFKILSYERR